MFLDNYRENYVCEVSVMVIKDKCLLWVQSSNSIRVHVYWTVSSHRSGNCPTFIAMEDENVTPRVKKGVEAADVQF